MLMASKRCQNNKINSRLGLKTNDKMSSFARSSAKMQRPVPSLAVKDYKELETSKINPDSKPFVRSSSNEIKEDEKILLKKIDDAWQRKDLGDMFQLIKENHFSAMAQKKVLCFWDMGHYFQESERRKKPLTPLARFRIRERFLPPKHICPNGRQKATLPKEATNVLREWLENSPRPYPPRETKTSLAERTGLSVMQVNTWFANSRRRMRGGRKNQIKETEKTSYSLDETVQPLISTQPWPVPYFPTVMTSSQTIFPSCSGVCTCPSQFPQFLAPLPLDTNVRYPWQELNSNARSFMEWPASQTASIENQYLAPSMVALTPNLWEPGHELQQCGLHAAAQILMDMASK